MVLLLLLWKGIWKLLEVHFTANNLRVCEHKSSLGYGRWWNKENSVSVGQGSISTNSLRCICNHHRRQRKC